MIRTLFHRKNMPYDVYPPVITTEFKSGNGTAQENINHAPVTWGILSWAPLASANVVTVSVSMSNISIPSNGDEEPP